jgi:hypothetical protein
MNVTEDELDQFEEQICKMFTRFLVKKIKSGSGTIIPDPAWPKGPGYDRIRIRIHNTALK